MILDRISD